MILDLIITPYQRSQLKDQNIDLALLIESTQLLDRLYTLCGTNMYAYVCIVYVHKDLHFLMPHS